MAAEVTNERLLAEIGRLNLKIDAMVKSIDNIARVVAAENINPSAPRSKKSAGFVIESHKR